MLMPGANSCVAELVLEKAGLARDRAAVDRAREMTDERTGHARIEHHRHFLGRDLARIEPRDRALAGGAADLLRRFEVAQVQRRGKIVIAFHRGALARDRAHRQAVARAEIGAGKAVARHQHHAADAGGGAGAVRLGDAFDRKTGALRPLRHGFERADGRAFADRSGRDREWSAPVGPASARPANRSSGVAARHRHGALGQRRHALARDVIGGNNRLPAADADAQAHVVAFRALGFLDRAVAHLRPPSDTERMATASAASAPAFLAACTSCSASAVRADWSKRESIRGFHGRCRWGSGG